MQPTQAKRIAYVMSRFPKISETFILYEILELERRGLQIDVFPLIRQQEQTVHAEAAAVVARANYSHVLSSKVLLAQCFWLVKRPRAYLGVWRQIIQGNISSFKFLIRALAVVLQASWFAKQMQEQGVNHVHAHYASHPALAAYVVRALTGIPYSFTAHAHDIYIYDERPMVAEKVQSACFVVTISKYNKRLLEELCGPSARDKVVVIHCGVDHTVFMPGPQRDSDEPFTIICVASLEEYKGQQYLIEACAELKAQNVDFRCVLVGQGADRAKIDAQIVTLGLQGEVILLGAQPRNRVKELVSTANVVVLPSVVMTNGKQEGIPVALMEAMACERPVIATAISGLPELIDHERTGLLVPERDASSLAVAIRYIYDDPEVAHKLGSAGRETVLAEFDLRRNVERLHALLLKN